MMHVGFALLCLFVIYDHAYGAETDEVYVKYNEVAHMFHSLRKEMLIEFKEPNETAGQVILDRVDKILDGFKELKTYAVYCTDTNNMFQLLEPIFRFIVLRGKPQFFLIQYSYLQLQTKYGWDYEQIHKFGDTCLKIREILVDFYFDLKERSVSFDEPY